MTYLIITILQVKYGTIEHLTSMEVKKFTRKGIWGYNKNDSWKN